MNRLMMVLAGSAVLSGAWVSRADVITIGSNLDNTLYESFIGELSNGRGEHMFAGSTAGHAYRRALVAFDVAGVLPDHAVIMSASLTLHMSRSASGDQDVSLHRVLSAWGEGTSNAGGEEGDGAPSTPGDATWIHTYYDTDFWTNPGGDFVEQASATSVVGFGTDFYTWASNAMMVADVQAWFDDPSQSFGWEIICNESVPRTAKRFDTREHANESYRPMLTIEYEIVPAPATVVLVTLGFGGIGMRRRRR
jgi:hypothetical protein